MIDDANDDQSFNNGETTKMSFSFQINQNELP